MNENLKKFKENTLIVIGTVVFISGFILNTFVARRFPGNSLAGVITQVDVLISVLLSVLISKKGLITAIILNFLNFLYVFVFLILIAKNYSTVPGLVSPFITIITCCIIYMYSSKIAKANEEVKIAYNELTETNRIIREKDEKLVYLAYYDILTGLANRQLFIEQIDEMIVNNSDSYFNVVIADIDDFKRIIDAYGHNTGDIVISTYADRLRSYCGQSGFIAKFGEEEFALIIKNTPDDTDIEEYIDKLRMTLFAPVVVNDVPIQLTMSFGVTEYPAAGKNSNDILRNTDIAVTNAKMMGRGRICFLNQNKYL